MATKLSKYYFHFFANVLIALLFLMIFNCNFNTNDDLGMKFIVSGHYGISDYHLVYINSIFGYILHLLYTYAPNIPWYEIIQYLLLVISVSVIMYVLTNANIGYGKLILLFLYPMLIYFLYYKLQFTKTSFACAISGYLLVYRSLEQIEKENSLHINFFAILLLILSYILRYEEFFLTSIIIVFIFSKYFIMKNRTCIIALIKYAFIVFLLIGICL